MKKIILVGFIFLIFLPISTVAGEDILEESYYRKPVMEHLDLMVDGSINPVLVNITGDFDYIVRIIWDLHYAANDINFDTFGLLPALTNGTEMVYDGSVLNSPIRAIHDLSHTSYDLRIDTDDKNPKDNHVSCRLTFSKFIPPYGLKIKEGHIFQIRINDDLTSVGDRFDLSIEGFIDVNYEPDFKRDWFEDMFVFDNPLKFVALIFTIPAAMIFTWEPVGIMIGVGIAFIELVVFAGIWRRLMER